MGARAQAIVRDLRAAASEEKRAVLVRFFKTGKGEYGEGDRFWGVMVPQIRAVAKKYAAAGEATEEELLASPWHEARECALFMMCNRFARAGEAEREKIHSRYLAAAAAGRVNNWDLVDASAPTLVGRYLFDKPRGLLDGLAARPSLWENRIAIVSTLAFVRRGELDDAFRLAEKLLSHPHDLMHKAVGWVLRECGKKDADRLRAFLRAHAAAMPRTALRYAIERFSPAERAQWLAVPAAEKGRRGRL
jgi:3-methyladenine DNA glycosylase AlkD